MIGISRALLTVPVLLRLDCVQRTVVSLRLGLLLLRVGGLIRPITRRRASVGVLIRLRTAEGVRPALCLLGYADSTKRARRLRGWVEWRVVALCSVWCLHTVSRIYIWIGIHRIPRVIIVLVVGARPGSRGTLSILLVAQTTQGSRCMSCARSRLLTCVRPILLLGTVCIPFGSLVVGSIT